MEDSLNSPVKNNLMSTGTCDSAEESGWTAYFEDLYSSHSIEQSFPSSSSLVSDAASCAASKISDKNIIPACYSSIGKSQINPKRLSFKKSRAREIHDDDPLEDTASSPVNSPKVCNLEEMGVCRKKDGASENSQGKAGMPDSSSELQISKSKMSFSGQDDDFTELKKRGLCVVPLSMLVNYIG